MNRRHLSPEYKDRRIASRVGMVYEMALIKGGAPLLELLELVLNTEISWEPERARDLVERLK